MAQCTGELSSLPIPVITTCPTDNELLLFTNVIGVTGGYAFRSWRTVRQCLLSKLLFVVNQFKIGQVGAPMTAGQTVLTISVLNILTDSVRISLGGSDLPRSDNTQISYTVDYYNINPNAVTITFDQGVINGQQYVIYYAQST